MACKNDTKDTKLRDALLKNYDISNALDRDYSIKGYYQDVSINKNFVAKLEMVLEKAKENVDYSKLIKPIPLPQSTTQYIGKAFAIGKELKVIGKNSYGPSLKIRNQGESVIVDPKEDIDSFRIISAKYWATTDDEKSLIYLNEEGIKHKIVNYNFVQGIPRIFDIKLKNSLQKIANGFFINNFSLMDFALNKFTQQTSKLEEQTVFSTQQWVLISPKKENFLIQKTKSIPFINSSQMTEKMMVEKAAGITKEKKIYLGSGLNTIKGMQPVASFLEYSFDMWKLYVNGGTSTDGKIYSPLIVTDKDYFDYAFELPIPFLKSEIEKNILLNSPMIVDCNFNYTFYIKEYEEKIKTISERLLPNFYVFEMEMTHETNNPEYQKMITLGNTLNVKDAILIPPLRINDFREFNKSYFNKLGEQFASILRDGKKDTISRNKIGELESVDSTNTNIGIPIDNVEILNKFYDYRVMFPMYVDLQFSTDKTTVVSNILHDCRLDKSLMKDIIVGDNNKYKNLNFIESVEIISEEKNGLGGNVVSKGFTFSNSTRRVWDITQWMSDIKEKEIQVKNGLLLYREDDTGNEQENEIVRNLMRIIFVGKIKKFVKDKFRTYEEMINGKLAYSETVMYRIEKSLADDKGNKNGDAIQNFYVSNGNEIEILKLVDTQVKYNTRYRYDVYAYQLVIGTKYRYVDKQVTDESAIFSVIQTPSIILAEVPYFSFSDIMLDCPPVRPDVEIIPYKGINNKLLFMFAGNVGDYQEVPIIIDATDKISIDEYKRSEKLGPNDPIRFKSDDHASIFQIYRTTIKPKDYKDFAGKLLTTIQTDVSSLTAQSATSAAYIDTISPNKKYWYCFRSIDNHGHLSQPTEVFQAEMVDDHGMVYPIIEVFDMEKEKEDKKPSKPMKRYLYISPTLLQKLLDEDKSQLVDVDSVKDYDPKKIKLGLEDKVVWGNDYKIRLTSKKTGKKVDINVKCSYDGIRKEKAL